MRAAPRAASAWPFDGLSCEADALSAPLAVAIPPNDAVRPVRRLASRAQFDAAMSHPSLARTAHFALHMLRLEQLPALQRQDLFGCYDATWVGCVIPKRHARRAVTRNTVRRQIYAAIARQPVLPLATAWVARLHLAWGPGVARSATSATLRAEVRRELDDLFRTGLHRLATQRERAATGPAA